jgi:hypothetical protein
MIEILIIIYIIENLYILYKQYKKPMGIFSPVYIVAFMSLGQILPQLTTIYCLPQIYDRNIMYNLLFTMISCNLAFYLGSEKEIQSKPSKVLEIRPNFILILIVAFAPCSYIFDKFISAKHAGIETSADGVIAFQFQALGFISLILALCYLRKHKMTPLLIGCLLLSTLPIIHYAFGVYGSRLSTFVVVLLYAYLFTIKFPHRYNLIKKLFTIFFIIGCIGSLSIGEVRTKMTDDTNGGLRNIDYIDNMKQAFLGGSYNPMAGMDLGNAALGIEHCYQLNEYNWGLFIWNGFVFNYIPRRLVGQEIKDDMTVHFESDKYVQKLTHGITCPTGYYDAFSSFAWFGFIIFYALARLFTWLRNRGKYSVFYLTMYFYMLTNTAVAITHGLQIVFAKVEFMIILFSLLGFTLYQKKVNRQKTVSEI